MNKEFIILTDLQINTLEGWMKRHEENFGDMWNDRTVVEIDGRKTFNKEFCAYVNFAGDRLYRISEEVVNFLLALIDIHYGGDHVYDPLTGVVCRVTGEPYHWSLQHFIDNRVA